MMDNCFVDCKIWLNRKKVKKKSKIFKLNKFCKHLKEIMTLVWFTEKLSKKKYIVMLSWSLFKCLEKHFLLANNKKKEENKLYWELTKADINVNIFL